MDDQPTTVDEFLAQLDIEIAETPKWKRSMWKWQRRLSWSNIKYVLKTPKHWYQRARYGVSERDCWNLDSYLARVIARGVESMRTDKHVGTPSSIYHTYGEEQGSIVWDNILRSIIEGFTLYIDPELLAAASPEAIERDRKVELAKRLLNEHFESMWT